MASSSTLAAAQSTTFPPTSTVATPNLVPIRVDATWDQVRIIDTILIDPKCLPIPLHSPLEKSVEDNVQFLAHSVIMDAEVYGMGRTVRHFTGRTDAWTRGYQQKVANIIRPQLVAAVLSKSNKKGEIKTIHLRLSINGVNINDDFKWDPNVPDACPIAFAKMLVKDLKLPEDEFVPAIATAIVEQLGGIQVESSAKPTSAFKVDVREQVTNLAHLSTFHRPSTAGSR